jgi:hypothetical protein
MPVHVVYTYDQTTPESAADGDHSASGFYEGAGNRWPATDPDAGHGETMLASAARKDIQQTVGSIDSMQLSETMGGECKLAVYGSPDCIDFRTGTDESISAHVTGPKRLLLALQASLGGKS